MVDNIYVVSTQLTALTSGSSGIEGSDQLSGPAGDGGPQSSCWDTMGCSWAVPGGRGRLVRWLFYAGLSEEAHFKGDASRGPCRLREGNSRQRSWHSLSCSEPSAFENGKGAWTLGTHCREAWAGAESAEGRGVGPSASWGWWFDPKAVGRPGGCYTGMACLSLGVAVAAAWVGLKQETGDQRSGGWGEMRASGGVHGWTSGFWRWAWSRQRESPVWLLRFKFAQPGVAVSRPGKGSVGLSAELCLGPARSELPVSYPQGEARRRVRF